MLVVASAAPLKVRANGDGTIGRRSQNRFESCPRKPGLLFGQSGFHVFIWEYKRNEDTLTGTSIIRRKSGQSIATVDQLFNVQLHWAILNAKPKLEIGGA